MTLRAAAVLVLAFGLAASCGGSTAPATMTATAPGAAPVGVERFGPGLASHESSADEALGDVTRVLSASYKLAPSGEPGVVTTEWKEFDEPSWPGAQTRLRVEVTAARVIVFVECRAVRDSCVRTVPELIDLVEIAREVAEESVSRKTGDGVVRTMSKFKDQICACADRDCVENVEKEMMKWALAHMDQLKSMKPTRAQDEAADRIEEAMDVCKERIDPARYSHSAPSYSHGSTTPITPAPPGGTGSVDCDAYLDTFDELVAKCASKIGPALDPLIQSRNAQLDAFIAWNQLDPAAKRSAIQASAAGCKAARDALRQSAASLGCPL